MIFLSSTVLDGYLEDQAWLTWTPTWTAALGSGGTVSSVTSRYKYAGNEIYYVIRASLILRGTWNGDLRFSLPVTAIRSSSGIGRNLNTGAILQHLALAGTDQGITWTKDNAFPLSGGQAFAVHGRYTWK